jgi:hypothetical protein
MSSQSITDTLATWRDNFVRNTSSAFTTMTPERYIRLVVIVGTYALLRPYLIKLGAKLQEKQHERDAAEVLGDIHPNELRTGKKYAIPGLDEDDDEDEDDVQPGDWGKTARVRQRNFIRQALEKEEKRLQDEQEAESDKEIEDLLVD